jgi:hypothetical protein
MRIVSTGAYAETGTARRDLPARLDTVGDVRGLALRAGAVALRRADRPAAVVPSTSFDLEGFAESLRRRARVPGAAARLLGRSLRELVAPPDAGFGLAAVASCDADPAPPPTAAIELFAQSP